MSEALRALGVLLEPPCAEHAAIAGALDLPPPPTADDHTAVLGSQLPPYASIYLGAEGMVGGEARDRIAGFWRALGAQPPHEPDHLSVLCAALAQLVEADRPASPREIRAANVEPVGPGPAGAARTAVSAPEPAIALAALAEAGRPTGAPAVDPSSIALAALAEADRPTGAPAVDPGSIALADPADPAALADLTDPRRSVDAKLRLARAALYWEHIASWMPPYLAALRRIGALFHAAWADTLAAVLAAEAEVVGPSRDLPLALRAAPALPEAPADLDALLSIVLASVRIGLVIARDDLARCAAALGLGLRAGERRFALRALLAQDPAGVLGWLADEARRQADGYGDQSEVARWWQARALVGARWLDQRAAEAAAIAGQSG